MFSCQQKFKCLQDEKTELVSGYEKGPTHRMHFGLLGTGFQPTAGASRGRVFRGAFAGWWREREGGCREEIDPPTPQARKWPESALRRRRTERGDAFCRKGPGRPDAVYAGPPAVMAGEAACARSAPRECRPHWPSPTAGVGAGIISALCTGRLLAYRACRGHAAAELTCRRR